MANGSKVEAAAGDFIFAIFNALEPAQKERVLNTLAGVPTLDPQVVNERHTVREDELGLIDVVEPRRTFEVGGA